MPEHHHDAEEQHKLLHNDFPEFWQVGDKKFAGPLQWKVCSPGQMILVNLLHFTLAQEVRLDHSSAQVLELSCFVYWTPLQVRTSSLHKFWIVHSLIFGSQGNLDKLFFTAEVVSATAEIRRKRDLSVNMIWWGFCWTTFVT